MLELKGVNLSYGSVQTLFDVDITVNDGEVVALLGANGAGKSSILNAISGLNKIRSGEILLNGEPIHTKDAAAITKLGVIQCPEGRQIFAGLTVGENLKLGSYVRKNSDAIKADLDRVYSMFPWLENRHNQMAGTLSGGEQQMLAIGRALMSAPKILLLDEPSLGLSPKIVKKIFATIKQINDAGTTVLLVEQNVKASMKIAAKAYILELGHVALSGTPEELNANDNIRKLYLGAG